MLKSFAQRHHLVLKKGQNLHILTQLVINYILLAKLKVIKKIKDINHPIVHYYGLCWNEERMLPFMFDYYGQFVDFFTIYDNYSTDKSELIIRSHNNTEIIKFSMNNQINDFVYQNIKNNCWKKSRGKADYVVVCDMDEFIYTPQIRLFLKDSLHHHISLFHPKGFEMYSKDYPNHEKEKLLTDLVKKGIASSKYGKCILFDPHRIVEINYEPGAHICSPLGIVKENAEHQLKMLHYKNLDEEIIVKKSLINAARLSQENIDAKFGVEYLRSESKIRDEFNRNLSQSTIVI